MWPAGSYQIQANGQYHGVQFFAIESLQDRAETRDKFFIIGRGVMSEGFLVFLYGGGVYGKRLRGTRFLILTLSFIPTCFENPEATINKKAPQIIDLQGQISRGAEGSRTPVQT